MQLITPEIAKAAQAQYPMGSSFDQLVVAKFFTPWTNWTWYLMNQDPDDPDYCLGIVSGHEVECGSFSIDELESICGPAGLRIERDLHFKPRSAKSIWQDLDEGKHV